MGLVHSHIDALLDDLWDLPLTLGSDAFDEWEAYHPMLVDTGLGDDFPDGFEEFLRTHGVSTEEFRDVLESLVEIAFGSFYCDAEDANSLRYLDNLIRMVRRRGVSPPPIDTFSASRFSDRHGWGDRLSIEERDAWRSLTG